MPPRDAELVGQRVATSNEMLVVPPGTITVELIVPPVKLRSGSLVEPIVLDAGAENVPPLTSARRNSFVGWHVLAMLCKRARPLSLRLKGWMKAVRVPLGGKYDPQPLPLRPTPTEYRSATPLLPFEVVDR